MSMIDGMATLVITSPEHPAYWVSTVLGLEPDFSAEKGDLRPRQGDTGTEPIRRRVFDTSMWVLEVDSNPGTKMAVVEDDAKGFATLQVLADRLLGRGPQLAQLRVDYRVELTWYGTADAGQTGFLLTSRLLSDLAELGLDVSCTVYSHDDTSERPGLHSRPDQGAAGSTPVPFAPDASASGTQPTSQSAAEQLLIDQMIAQQLLEQQLADLHAAQAARANSAPPAPPAV